MHIIFWLENLREGEHLEGLSVDGKIILQWILGKEGVNVWTGCIWIRIGTSGRLLQTCNEPMGSIKSREFLD